LNSYAEWLTVCYTLRSKTMPLI